MKTDNVKIERGSENVFVDLGIPDADAHLLKAELVTRIDKIIRRRGLKQVEAAKLLGLSQPRCVAPAARELQAVLHGAAPAPSDGAGARCGYRHPRAPFGAAGTTQRRSIV